MWFLHLISSWFTHGGNKHASSYLTPAKHSSLLQFLLTGRRELQLFERTRDGLHSASAGRGLDKWCTQKPTSPFNACMSFPCPCLLCPFRAHYIYRPRHLPLCPGIQGLLIIRLTQGRGIWGRRTKTESHTSTFTPSIILFTGQLEYFKFA